MKKTLALVLSLLLLFTALPSCRKKESFISSFLFMDTVITVTLYTTDEPLADRTMAQCKQRLSELEQLWSRHIAGSDISRLNNSDAGISDLDPRTVSLLLQAQEISANTGGAFDITLAPLSDLWQICGEEDRLPTNAELSALLALTGTARLSVTGTSATKPTGMQLDLGGIGKGAAISQLLALVSESGVTGGLISFGSNVAAFGSKPDGSPFRVALRDPKDANGTVGTLNLPAGSILSVSGDYERYVTINGENYHHILDPKTGIPAASGLSSATVICTNGALADALSTALLVMGLDAALALQASNIYSFEAILITSNGEIFTTPGLEGFT